MLKLLLPHKVELHVPVWSKGTPEQFLVHIQQALNAIRQKGLQTALKKAVKHKEECTKKLNKASEAVACEEETMESLIAQVFQLYSNLLLE